mgnify:CR=1 FL=1
MVEASSRVIASDRALALAAGLEIAGEHFIGLEILRSARENNIQPEAVENIRMDEKVLIKGEQLLRVVKERNPEVLVTMGAGDINQYVGPLREWCMRI